MLPNIHNVEIHQDSKTILFQGSKLEDQYTRKTLRMPNRVYKPSDNPIVFGAGNPCWSYGSQDLHPTKTVKGVEMHIPPPKCHSFNDYIGQAVLKIEGLIRMQLCVSSHTRDVELAWK